MHAFIKKVNIFKIVCIAVSVLLIGSCCYLFIAYKDFTCYGCLHVPSLNVSKKEKALIAIYCSSNGYSKDTLYLTQAGVWGKGAHYYTDDFIVGNTGNFDAKVVSVKDDSKYNLATVFNGKIASFVRIKTIPKSIKCCDSKDSVLLTFKLIKTYTANIAAGSKMSFIKELKHIVKSY